MENFLLAKKRRKKTFLQKIKYRKKICFFYLKFGVFLELLFTYFFLLLKFWFRCVKRKHKLLYSSERRIDKKVNRTDFFAHIVSYDFLWTSWFVQKLRLLRFLIFWGVSFDFAHKFFDLNASDEFLKFSLWKKIFFFELVFWNYELN